MSKISECKLRNLYLEKKKTDREIGELFGLSQPTVWYYRNKYGIPSIEAWERHTCEPTDIQMQFIAGSLLGDSGMSDGKKEKWQGNSLLSVMHCSAQKEYVFWKYRIIKNLCNSPPKPTRKNAWWFNTFQHPFFTNIRKNWYPNGEKRIDLNNLKVINDSDLALAVWYMDDGSLHKKKPHLATCSFTEKEHVVLSKWLKDKFDIESHMGKGEYRYLIIDSADLFLTLIANQLKWVKCMRHKLPKEYHTWEN